MTRLGAITSGLVFGVVLGCGGGLLRAQEPQDAKAQQKQIEQDAKKNKNHAKAQEKAAKAQEKAAKAQQKAIDATDKVADHPKPNR